MAMHLLFGGDVSGERGRGEHSPEPQDISVLGGEGRDREGSEQLCSGKWLEAFQLPGASQS